MSPIDNSLAARLPAWYEGNMARSRNNFLLGQLSRLPATSIQYDALQQVAVATSNFKSYLDVQNWVFRQEPLACFTNLYQQMFLEACENEQWFAEFLVENLNKSIESATDFRKLSLEHTLIAQNSIIRAWSSSQLHNAAIFTKLLRTVFPTSLDDDMEAEIQAMIDQEAAMALIQSDTGANDVSHCLSQILDHHWVFLRDYIRIRLASVAARALAPDDSKIDASGLIDKLALSQFELVPGTAKLINSMCLPFSIQEKQALFMTSVNKVINRTSEETIDFHYNLRFGNYP